MLCFRLLCSAAARKQKLKQIKIAVLVPVWMVNASELDVMFVVATEQLHDMKRCRFIILL